MVSKKSFAWPLHGLSGHFVSLVVSKKSFATPRDGLSGHFASLVVSKKVPPTYGDFDFFFSKIPPILKLEVGFFSIKKVFEIFRRNTVNYLFIN